MNYSEFTSVCSFFVLCNLRKCALLKAPSERELSPKATEGECVRIVSVKTKSVTDDRKKVRLWSCIAIPNVKLYR